MKSSKKPDNVAWNEESQEYISKLLPYAISNSSPVISIPNVDSFKKKGVDKVSKQFQAELADLQNKIKTFVDLAKDTQMVYSAKFKFEPIVGETYHLYQGEKESFLSLIEPNSWNKKHVGSFRLSGDYKWERL
tara:strand:- start:338 stop:736 length:399 start_codon:yes stop_codon:yes gene_type:complete